MGQGLATHARLRELNEILDGRHAYCTHEILALRRVCVELYQALGDRNTVELSVIGDLVKHERA